MATQTAPKQFINVVSTREVTCWCSIRLAIPESLFIVYDAENDRNPGSYTLYCPLGHGFTRKGGGEAQRLRDELARQKHLTEQAEADARNQRSRLEIRDRQLAARKGQITKLRKRIANGVCPCCNRHFTNLERHMHTKHPQWAPENHDAGISPDRERA